jgi:hydroxyacylglutathione hydrolase
LFCGDTLFSAGCGRLFEGTAAQMHQSLARLAALPAETQVYCAHEYTRANLRFAHTVEPENAAILRYRSEVDERQAHGEPTLPSTIGLEREINPFLRVHVPAVRVATERHFETTLSDAASVFAAVRRWKDGFRG